jgi:hypothetical protein
MAALLLDKVVRLLLVVVRLAAGCQAQLLQIALQRTVAGGLQGRL